MTERGGNFQGNPFHAASPFHGDMSVAAPFAGREQSTSFLEAIAAVGGRVLEPAHAPAIRGVRPQSTAYIGPRLLVSKGIEFEGAVQMLRSVAELHGWSVEPEDEDPQTAGLRFGVRAIRLDIASDVPTAPPDAWTLLQHARAQYGVDSVGGVALDHVFPVESSGPSNPSATAVAGLVGEGPRPMAYIGPAPTRVPVEAMSTRRPVVAILDTACGSHPWLDDVVVTDLTLDGGPIGYADGTDMSDPWTGRGTFIAGLVHQACPDADILSWCGVRRDGTVIESDLIASVAQIAELGRRFRAEEPGGHVIDVLSLSVGYHHETPEVPLLDLSLYETLRELARNGTLVVCSAGDDASTRPTFPAAFGPWADGAGPTPVDQDVPPIVSVGALNPNGITDALSSNTGPWVRAHAQGTELMSTLPAFPGGRQPVAQTTAFGRVRGDIDPDDFRGGFGRWSGTSFAAPLLAARLASRVQDDLGSGDDTASAVARAWSAIEDLTDIAR